MGHIPQLSSTVTAVEQWDKFGRFLLDRVLAVRRKPYRPKGWAHHLDRDLLEQDGEALQRKNRRRAGRAINDMKGRDGLAGADSTKLFLADLKKNGLALLSREQEVDLARRVQ